MKKQQKIKLELAVEWHEEIGGREMRSASLGPEGEICLLLASSIPVLRNGMFPQSVTEEQIDYSVWIWAAGKKTHISILGQKWNYHFAQPIGDHVLLVCARSENYGNGKADENARIFDRNGKFIGSFCMGDGIEQIAVGSDETIWASYFDEGIFGNYGWEEPIGSVGWIRWDKEGGQLEAYKQPETHFIEDCYAMNLAAPEELWFYYYSDFHIGRRKNGETQYFIPEVKGARVFAVSGEWALFDGGYPSHDRFYLLQQNGSRYRRKKELVFADEKGKKIRSLYPYARGSQLLLQGKTGSYLVDLKNFI